MLGLCMSAQPLLRHMAYPSLCQHDACMCTLCVHLQLTAFIKSLFPSISHHVSVINGSSQCAAGDASFSASGSSNAVGTARSFASAYAFALGTAEDCNRCKTSASFVAEEFEALVVEATASLEFRLAGGASPGAPASVKFDEFVAEFVEATASAFASVGLLSPPPPQTSHFIKVVFVAAG